jgi:ribonuclease HII
MSVEKDPARPTQGRPTQPTAETERAMLAGGGDGLVIGVDEVGRGALAGPVSIGAVAIDSTCIAREDVIPSGIRDSKVLSAKRRRELVPLIESWVHAHAVTHVPAERVDQVGIIRALGEGARDAVRAIQRDSGRAITVVLLDGRHDFLAPVDDAIPVCTVVKGDASCISIAAASILAKVQRDELMSQLHQEYPHYGWNKNVGYGTAQHQRAIATHGITPLHRASWRLTPPS